MNFSFDGFSKISEPSSVSYLKPWNIYENVTFKGVSDPVSGNKSDGTTWKAWDFTFECREGVYSERIFEPTTTERGNFNGKELPSDFERSQQFVVQVLAAFNPKGLEKLREITKAGKIKTFEQFIQAVSKLLSNVTTTGNIKLKLQGRKSTGSDGTERWYAKLPNASLNNDGQVFMSKFVGATVPAFNSWEEGQKKLYESASPTNPESRKPVNDIDTTNKESDDDLFNDLGEDDLGQL